MGSPARQGNRRIALPRLDLQAASIGTLACVLLLGCGNEEDRAMPLQEHHTWSYMVRAGLQNLPDNVTVTRRIPVGDVDGYELAGELGVSHLAWRRGRLITDQMAGVRFTPPITILAPNDESVQWSGWVDSGDRREPAKAIVTHAATKLEVLGRPEETTRSDVDMKIADRKLQLSTWFEPGVGIVRQDQRTNDRLDVTLELLAE